MNQLRWRRDLHGVLTFLKTCAKYRAPRIPEYEIWRNRFVRHRLSLGVWLVGLVYISFLILELWSLYVDPDSFDPMWLTTQLTTLMAMLVCGLLVRSRWGQRHSGLVFLFFSGTVSLIPLVQRAIAGFLEPSLLVWPAIFLGQATLIPVRWRLHVVAQLIALGPYWLLDVVLNLDSDIPLANLGYLGLWVYLGWICVICNLSVYLYERLRRSEFTARRQLEEAYHRITQEQERSEKLLLNILPHTIAKRLKEQTEYVAIADSFSHAGVLFADIVGFTALSSKVSPPELVQLLNEIFSEFDRLAELHGLEKIKTIGDAYMVVSGLPESRDDFAEAIADMALDMREALVQFNQQHQSEDYPAFSMRVGIAIGPVVAGVIGLKKFIYDLWGDTVNLASRMESHGLPDSIQVTQETYEALQANYRLDYRGEIEIKGKGKTPTYLLLEKSPIPPSHNRSDSH
ncbi:adenylate/guanylate cyclase domain-containing protein [Geitlerinema sp. P-1104]|uniref:adenylate/guanylate cyclase domain-containing protein n=1 Tax=Geitlerinema sp. P-1104 TaxID=2546230 RepID=UPI0014771680|nr:adenylate/guanylate cyclase domain-containing protein [Geitlerinema sp. P-1104]NMG59954.1 adenylate/guanylate cyclase domain-containing protein [Geitlerinema sp. P-1104]